VVQQFMLGGIEKGKGKQEGLQKHNQAEEVDTKGLHLNINSFWL
jgi:hypothetical protein